MHEHDGHLDGMSLSGTRRVAASVASRSTPAVVAGL
jgi:hypothetical protein